jgi:long-chain acyl-CoA synthetase
MTLIEMLLKNAELYPEKTAIIHGDVRFSYKEFREKSMALAIYLWEIGLKKGDRVGLLVEKCPQAVIAFLGINMAGGIVCPIDNNQPSACIQSVIDSTNPAALVVSHNFLTIFNRLKPSLSKDHCIVIGGQPEESCRSWDEVMTRKSPHSIKEGIKDDDAAFLNFTSGITGVPKGAVTTHANIYWNTRAAVEGLELTHDDIHLCMFPVFLHTFEILARALYLGGTIVLPDDTMPISIARAISAHRVTCMMAVALIYQTLVRYPPPGTLNCNSLRLAESGGMPVSSTLAYEFEKLFRIPIIPVWGSTETTGIALAAPIHGGNKSGSMGKPLPHYEAKVVDEDGTTLPVDEIGEMAIKGPAVCSEYFGNPLETGERLKDGWYFTGDLVRRDVDDFYYFVGRKSGLIKVAGLKVYPMEIENVLKEHPKIAEVAVVKSQNNLQGEVPKAVIVLKKDTQMSKTDIREFCAKQLPRYKVPEIVEFVHELPKTPGGKILYREL